MAVSRIPGCARPVSIALQELHIKRRFPSFIYQWKQGEGQWQGKLQPREVSPTYKVQVCYKPPRTPRVRVLSPSLSPRAQHLYTGGYLCLFWPKEWTWSQDVLIAETIIPWTALWLLNYELLLDTGEWLGPSAHQESPKRAVE